MVRFEEESDEGEMPEPLELRPQSQAADFMPSEEVNVVPKEAGSSRRSKKKGRKKKKKSEEAAPIKDEVNYDEEAKSLIN